MKKITMVLITFVSACLAFSACSTPLPTTEIVFPNHEFGKAEQNAEIYNISPFSLDIKFPENWVVVYPKSEEEVISGFSSVTVYSEKKQVCEISYNVFKLYEGTTEENFYRSVYNQLMLSSTVTWDNNYTVIKSDDDSSVAVCDVLVNAPTGEFTFPGILAYSKATMTYIQISFEHCEIDVTKEMLDDIAESINLSR